jgi:hypothetical protein
LHRINETWNTNNTYKPSYISPEDAYIPAKITGETYWLSNENNFKYTLQKWVNMEFDNNGWISICSSSNIWIASSNNIDEQPILIVDYVIPIPSPNPLSIPSPSGFSTPIPLPIQLNPQPSNEYIIISDGNSLFLPS